MHDAIVIGAGHNGLITAAYLAKAGMRTLVLEARSIVGGTAASEQFAGGTVNVCNCDHITLRTTPVIDDLDLASFGLRYIEIEPTQVATAWSGGPPWQHWHDVERTLDELAATHPGRSTATGATSRAARPAAELILAAATEPPTAAGLTRVAVRRRMAGATTVLRWSRRSAAVDHALVLLPRRRARRRTRRRSDGVGRQPRAARDRARRTVVRHAPRRRRRAPGRRQRRAHRGAARGGRPPRRRAAHRQHGRRRALRRRAGDGRRSARRHGDHGADRRLGMRPAAHVRAVAAAQPCRGDFDDRAVAAGHSCRGLRVEDRRHRRSRASAPRQRARPVVVVHDRPDRSPTWTGPRRCCRPAASSSARRCWSTCRPSPTRPSPPRAATSSASRCC